MILYTLNPPINSMLWRNYYHHAPVIYVDVSDVIDVYAVKVHDIEHELFHKLISFLPAGRQALIRRYFKRGDALRALISSILVRYVISGRLGIGLTDIKIGIGRYGKPYLVNCDGFDFNISHSNEWVICAAGSSRVGADIEYMAPIDTRFVKGVFTDDESALVAGEQDADQRLRHFYDIWTMKESFVKAVGKGVYIPFDTFSMCDSKKKGIKFKAWSDGSLYSFMGRDFDENYRIAVCSTAPEYNRTINVIEQGTVIGGFLREPCGLR